jgi:predicted nucleic acid-binding protein
MKGKVFLDTNIFVYTQSVIEPQKKSLSLEVLEQYDCTVSTQVLNELCNVFTKKFNLPIKSIGEIIKAINLSCNVSLVTMKTIEAALDIKERYGYSYYDSLILASALECNCDYLLSEDMNDGQVIDKQLEIVNIFVRPELLQRN